MAKISKKVSNVKAKKRSGATSQSKETEPDVLYDIDDKDLSQTDGNISGEEEEEEAGEDERRRQMLLGAIGALGGKRRKHFNERSEAAVQMSEFTVNAEGEGDKINLTDLIGSAEKTPAISTKTRKQLKSLQESRKTIETPLSKQQSERIQRDVAFQKAATEVSSWSSVIKQNQRAEQLVFPLNQEPPGPKPIERIVTGWKARTPLEQEIFALLSANKQPINDPILTPAEKASMNAMSLEEAKIRRAELQKARALQSYYEAKARRESKIKSKKYHKVQNKAKRKEYLKQFDKLVKSDPAAALEELNKIELARMQERMSLKHQNSGKWAKAKVLKAKYSEEARKAMRQQLQVNKDLTQKVATSLVEDEDEDENDEAANAEVVPDFANEAEQGPDSLNPWMRGKLSEEAAEKETCESMETPVEEASTLANAEEEENEEEEVAEEEALLQEFDHRRKLCKAMDLETATVISVDDNKTVAEEADASDQEEGQLSEFKSLYKGIAKDCLEQKANSDHSAQLEEGLVRIRSLEDMELLAQEEVDTSEMPVEPHEGMEAENKAAENTPSGSQKSAKNKKRKRGIELKNVLTKEAQVIQVPLDSIIEDTEDSDEKLDQRGLIKEAFAGDDVIADFLKDKRKQEDAGKPKMVDLTLPGWGEWGGMGLKCSKSKRRRFRRKTEPPPPRKDQNLPTVIISEKKNSSISLHQVNSLPFPFTNHVHFESTIRSPLGRTWNTEQSVRKFTKPKVVTQHGAIIEPISRQDFKKKK